MKKLLLSLFVLFLSLNVFGHDYYFSFAEIEYDADHSCLLMSIKVSTHDLDYYYQKKTGESKSIEKAFEMDSCTRKIMQFIQDGITISQMSVPVALNLEGRTTTKDGFTYFYFKSDKIDPKIALTVKYDLFMDIFTEQQNKINFIVNHQTKSYEFLLFHREHQINIY